MEGMAGSGGHFGGVGSSGVDNMKSLAAGYGLLQVNIFFWFYRIFVGVLK